MGAFIAFDPRAIAAFESCILRKMPAPGLLFFCVADKLERHFNFINMIIKTK